MLDTESDMKPNPISKMPPHEDIYLIKYAPWKLDKKYKTYDEFKKDFHMKKTRFSNGRFKTSNHHLFWRLVINETDRLIS